MGFGITGLEVLTESSYSLPNIIKIVWKLVTRCLDHKTFLYAIKLGLEECAKIAISIETMGKEMGKPKRQFGVTNVQVKYFAYLFFTILGFWNRYSRSRWSNWPHNPSFPFLLFTIHTNNTSEEIFRRYDLPKSFILGTATIIADSC